MLPNLQYKVGTGLIQQINCMVRGVIQRQALMPGNRWQLFHLISSWRCQNLHPPGDGVANTRAGLRAVYLDLG
jgi:hypothetical protein